MSFHVHTSILFAALVMHVNPPSNREFADPKTLHLSAEFTEANLGTRVDPDGRVVSRIIATQFEFVPNCVVVPANRDVTLRFASPDVVTLLHPSPVVPRPTRRAP